MSKWAIVGFFHCFNHCFLSEPTFDKNCIVIDVPDNSLIETQPLTWTTYDCDSIADTRPVCQYNYEMNHILPEQIGKLKKNSLKIQYA